MGFTPAQIDDMSLWEFIACADGYRKAHSPDKTKEVADVDEDRLRDLGIEGF